MKKHLLLLAVAVAVSACSTIKDMPLFGSGGWTTLVDDGKGIENFNRLGDANWRVQEGALQADRKTDKAPSYLVTKSAYGDFQLRVEFWASDDANSGIFMRCQDPKTITDKSCYEANIFDQRPDPSYATGAIVHIAKIPQVYKVGGRWSTYDITLKGSQLDVTLNGTKTASIRDDKFARGPFALQYGSGVVKFRKVQIRPL
jgi:hypothetical protein